VAEQIIQRTGLRICGEPGILEVAPAICSTKFCKSLDSGAGTG
jgi:hypothetical protein